MKEQKRKIAIYSRKSKFTGKGDSIANQIKMCKKKIMEQYPEMDSHDILVFEDEGFSGGNMNRPQFQAMMKLVKENKIETIYSYKLDRISRNVADFSNMYEILVQMNVAYISATEAYETSSPMGRAMMGIATVFAQLERETIAERIKDNMQALARTGRWLGGVTPTGYKSVPIVETLTIDGKERKAYKLDLVKKEAETVEIIFSKFLETNSLTKTETYLIQNNITTKNQKSYTRFSIKSILHNPVYMTADDKAFEYFKNEGVDICGTESDFNGAYGIMAYNKTIQKSGKANKLRGKEDWIVSVGRHLPIIGSEDWIQVQRQLHQNSSKAYRKPKSNVALLSGLLFCGNCGSFMRPKLSKRLNSDGEAIYSYLCELKEKSRMHNCDMKNPNGNELDRAVCEEIKKLSENSSEFIRGLETAKQFIDSNDEESQTQLNSLNKEFNENERKIKSLVAALEKSDDTPAYDYIFEQINNLHERNSEITIYISELQNKNNENKLSNQQFEVIRKMLLSFSESFETMSIEEKRNALRVFIKKIVWDGEQVHLYLFGSEENELDF